MNSPNKGNDFLPWVFFFLGIATRVPFTSSLLMNMDSCQFALALEKFDITVHQPHPPGYFLYILLGRLLNVVIRDPNTVFVSISVFFSGLTVACVYLLGKEVFERDVGSFAALLALSSPSFWFHGEVALSYIVEAFFSTAIAWCCWRIVNGEEKYLWVSAVALGVAGGIRQNTPVFLLPLWLYSVRNVAPGKIVAGLSVFAATCLSWFIPMVRMTGGWEAYRGAFRELWLFNTGGRGVLQGEWGYLRLFSLKMLLYLIYGLGAGLFPVALAAYSTTKRGQWKSVDPTKVIFFSLWVLPIMMFYLFIFLSIQNPGYILIFLPALFLVASFSILHIGKELGHRYGRGAGRVVLTFVVALNVAAFFLLKAPVSYRWIRNHDRNLSILLADVKKTFDPVETAVFVNNLIYYSYRHFMVYLPEFRAYNVDVRIAVTGERRKTFWGVNRETFLQDEVTLPASVTRFVTPIVVEDEKFGDRNGYEKEGFEVRDLTQSMFVASGPIASLGRVYPGFRVSFERRKSSS